MRALLFGGETLAERTVSPTPEEEIRQEWSEPRSVGARHDWLPEWVSTVLSTLVALVLVALTVALPAYANPTWTDFETSW
jgi:hypothetical protein